jgi:hypothetical protein
LATGARNFLAQSRDHDHADDARRCRDRGPGLDAFVSGQVLGADAGSRAAAPMATRF